MIKTSLMKKYLFLTGIFLILNRLVKFWELVRLVD
jgi:hypothetical protein